MKRFFASLVVIVLLAAGALAQKAAASDPWAALRFLIGTWEANTSGGMAHAQSAGDYSFQLELRDHVMSRHSAAGACKGSRDFDCAHSDLLYIYPGKYDQTWKAVYFDNEGHVIHYDVSVPRPGTAVFLSDSTQPGPQFRLTYMRGEKGMSGKFQVKMPGQVEFASYLEWDGQRKQ